MRLERSQRSLQVAASDIPPARCHAASGTGLISAASARANLVRHRRARRATPESAPAESLEHATESHESKANAPLFRIKLGLTVGPA